MGQIGYRFPERFTVEAGEGKAILRVWLKGMIRKGHAWLDVTLFVASGGSVWGAAITPRTFA